MNDTAEPTQQSAHASPRQPNQQRLRAAIFDMDGVITDTAEAHAAAWKRLFDAYLEERSGKNADFAPFDADKDYRRYVDGKPRYDGVKSFLESRGIDLPRGSPDDPPDRETICGLGNRKNGFFNDWLAENRVRAYGSSLRFIRDLRRAGLPVGIFSSSRNCQAVLESAGISDLFDARVDGEDLAKLDIPGKPDPAMLIECARRLGAEPAQSAIFEDAQSGVEAGARGDFAVVVGVDRSGQRDALKEAGADLVIEDLGEVSLDDGKLHTKILGHLPAAREHTEELLDRLAGRPLAVFLDYDGTLTPIVEDYTKAFLSEEMREALRRLAERHQVAVVSGRDLAYLRELVGLDNLFYAGSHGFDIGGPEGWRETLEKGTEYLDDLGAAEEQLRGALADIEGHAIERKRFSIAVHYRHVADDEVSDLERRLDGVLDDYPDLRKGGGKKVFRVQPRTDWDKGRAVLWLLERLDVSGPEVAVVYLGDDLTDEDAFRALPENGLPIAVGNEERVTAADYRLRDTEEVRWLLDLLTSLGTASGETASQ